MGTEDYPIWLREWLASGISKESEQFIQELFENILSEGKTNGVSETGASRKESMLLVHRCVFQITQGPDPPEIYIH